MIKNINLTAVIIDDHPLARLAIRKVLETGSITILEEAEDGVEAIRKVNRLQPDIVIIDEDIPLINGIEVVERLRKFKFTKIIIVLSGKNDFFYGKRSADAGANGFISKKEGLINIILAIHAAQRGYSYFPFSHERFIGDLTNEQQMLLSLSNQETKVMRAILDGANNMQIANEMHISNKTVSTYKKRLMEKLGCNSLMELFAFANRNKIG